jgi:hypothetical protein
MPEEAAIEIAQIRAQMQIDRTLPKSYWAMFAKPSYRKRSLLGRKNEQISASSSLGTHPLQRRFYQHSPWARVSAGWAEVSWRWVDRWACLAIHALAKPKMASLYFWRHSQSSCRVAMVEPPVSYSYLKSTVPAAACEVTISVRSAGRTYSTRRVRSLRLRSVSCAISSGLPPL